MQSKCKAMQSNFTRLVFVLILSNYLIINEAVALFRYAVFTGEEVCSHLRLSTRTLQEYRNSGTLPFYKIGGKILYKQSDI